MAMKPKLNLASFTGVVAAASGTAPDAEVDVTLIDVERQVRTDLGDLTDLAASIADIGVLEPIIVLARDGGRYRLISGERRFRASLQINKAKIPAVIKRGLTEFQIRQIQVTENNDREGLSAFDEAIGVAEDVQKFGFKEALRIWNRSEGWVSKRVAVTKYADPVRELLHTKLCGDLEVLHSLNQLYALSANEYDALVERLRNGVTVGRDDVRTKVASVKDWMKNADAAAQAIQNPTLPLGGGVPAVGGEAIGELGGEPSDALTEDAPAPKAKAEGKKARAKKPGPAGKTGKEPQFHLPGLAPTPEQRAVAERDHANIALTIQRAELMEWGDVLRPHLKSMQVNMSTLGFGLAESEWVLWTGFLDTVLPMLASLGKEHGAAYLKRLQSELKTKDPLAWWRELHPTGPGEDSESDQASREPVAEMPKGWTF